MKRIFILLFLLLFVFDVSAQRSKTRWQDLTEAVKDSVRSGTIAAGAVNYASLANAVKDTLTTKGYYGDYVVSAANSSPIDRAGSGFRAIGTSSNYVDHLTLQAAFDSAKSDIASNANQTGANIYVLKGSYYYDSIGGENGALVIDTSNINLFWHGDGYTVAAGNGYDIKVVNSDNVHIYGPGTLNGNGLAQTSDPGVGVNFDNCTNVSVSDITSSQHRNANFQFRSSSNITLINCVADSTTTGRGFIFDREGTSGSLTRGCRNILMVGCVVRRQPQAGVRLQQVNGFMFAAGLVDQGGTGVDDRTFTIANDDVTGVNVDTLENIAILASTIKSDGSEAEFKGLSGHGGSNLIAGNLFQGTLLTFDVADFTAVDTLSETSVLGNVFDPLEYSVSRIIQTGPNWINNRLLVSGNDLYCTNTMSNAMYFRGGDITVTNNRIIRNNARSIYAGPNVRKFRAIGNVITGTNAGGGNNYAFDIECDSAIVIRNDVSFCKWFAEVENDSLVFMWNTGQGITATGDTAITCRGAGVSTSNVFKYNFFNGYSINISDAGSSGVTSNHKFENYALSGDLDELQENAFILGGLGGSLTLEDTISADYITTPVVLDTLFIKTHPVITTNSGGDQVRIQSANTIQLLPGDQAAEYLRIGLSGNNVLLEAIGDSYWLTGDHISAGTDSVYALGHNSTTRFGYLSIAPKSYSHFENNLYEGKVGIISGASGDSLAIGINSTQYLIIGPTRIVTAPGP